MSAKKSTIVRSLSGQLQLLRLTFAALEAVAPPLGAWLVERIWFRMPVVPERARRLRVELPTGTPFEVPFEGRTIRGTAWGAGRTVHLLHGWGGWGLQMAAFVPPLVAAGFRVVTFDGPSHGDSDPGRDGRGRSTMPELADAFQAVVAAHGPAYGVIAHSMGAAAVSQALLGGLSARRIVFLAAATDFRHTVDQFQAMFGFGPRTRARFLGRFARRVGRPIEAFDLGVVIEEVLEERDLPPLLVVHDRDDRETPHEGSVGLAAIWPGAVLELTDGLGHLKVLWDPSVVESVVGFVSTDQVAGRGARVVQGTMRG